MLEGYRATDWDTSIIHFAVNYQETNRNANDARITLRALREIYLKGFVIAVKELAPWTVMSSYNHINGTYASENTDFLSTLLRYEWNFEGMVVTDWFGGKDAVTQMIAGNDMLQPGRAT
jgi:Beta-glucosidase-related glycosidases